ncbi:hypothetical protein OG320_11175 [Microbispora sp. NBC_01189]|nr:hypothetical protein OG320_11175 [Microbispora sp. NBC_01189]
MASFVVGQISYRPTDLPHYGHTHALIGTIILLVMLITIAIAVARSRRK